MPQHMHHTAKTAPASRGAVLLLLAALLTGCNAIYDDTKGWANRLEASILKAAHDLNEDPDAEEAESYTPEVVEPPRPGSPQQQMAAAPLPATPLAKPQVKPQVKPEPKPEPKSEDLAAEQQPPAGLVGDTAGTLLHPKAEAEQEKPEMAKAENAGPEQAKGADEEPVAKSGTPPLPKPKPQIAKAPASKKPGTQSAKAKTGEKEAGNEKKKATAAKPGNDVALVLHLASRRSEEAATREWRDLKQSYPEPLGSLKAEIRRTELGEKGVFYRILAGPLTSRSAAKDACAAVKARDAKQYCRVLPSSGTKTDAPS